MARFELPDVLVLGAGGVLGEAWMTGVLAGLEDAAGIDLRATEWLVGTSAGALVAARLAAGGSPRRPDAPPAGATPGPAGPRDLRSVLTGGARTAAAWGWAATAPVTSRAMALGRPGGALVRSVVLARTPSSERTPDAVRDELQDARFDGRLRVCCVHRASGRRVVFGAPGAPAATVAEAVAASCATPWLFAPVRIGGDEYVDGGVWSATNLDVAPGGRDAQVLCLDAISVLPDATGRGIGALRGAFRVASELEHQLLRGRGARVRRVRPQDDVVAAMGPDLLDPGPAQRVLAAGYTQGSALVAAAR